MLKIYIGYDSREDAASTEFGLTRFLTPDLAAHDGWSLFIDCDVLVTRDIAEEWWADVRLAEACTPAGP